MADELTLIQIDSEPSEACKADWQDAYRRLVERSTAIAAEPAFDWEGFTL